jgi:predicted nucleic acid-binding Zn ribbon protein
MTFARRLAELILTERLAITATDLECREETMRRLAQRASLALDRRFARPDQWAITEAAKAWARALLGVVLPRPVKPPRVWLLPADDVLANRYRRQRLRKKLNRVARSMDENKGAA